MSDAFEKWETCEHSLELLVHISGDRINLFQNRFQTAVLASVEINAPARRSETTRGAFWVADITCGSQTGSDCPQLIMCLRIDTIATMQPSNTPHLFLVMLVCAACVNKPVITAI